LIYWLKPKIKKNIIAIKDLIENLTSI